MRLYAISDLHVDHQKNRDALATLPAYRDDWLIVAGDVSHKLEQVRWCWETLGSKFERLIWVPGNHDLWCVAEEPLRGEPKYLQLVELCREFGVLTPEDPYPNWPGDTRHILVPLFLLYDYSFRPDHVTRSGALGWAEETGVVCADEHYLHPAPYESRDAWCEARCELSHRRIRERLTEADSNALLILINHWPLLQRLAVLPRVPRFTLWCGTKRSATWHEQFPVDTVIYGHLHIRNTQAVDGVRFEEVSLGYPRNWQQERGAEHYLRRIL